MESVTNVTFSELRNAKRKIMKISNFLSWHSKNLKDILFPLQLINWISGLNIVEIPVGHPRPKLSLIYIIIMIILYYYIPVVYGIFECKSENGGGAGEMLFRIISLYNLFVGLVLIIINWYYQKEVRLCIQRLELINVSLNSFGLQNDNGKIFIRLVSTLIVAFSGMVVAILTDIFWFVREKDLKTSIYCTVFLEFPISLQLINDLSFGTMVTTIGYSFRNMNSLLEKGTNKNLILENEHLNGKQFKISKLVLFAEFNFNSPDKSRNLIQLIKHQHLELSKISWEVEKVFGPQIAMSMITNITYTLGYGCYLYNSIMKSDLKENYDLRLIQLVNGICCCIFYFSRVWYVNASCAAATAEAHRVDELIFNSNMTNHNAELRKEIEQFSLQLNQRPMFFSMYGLTPLDYGFVANFLGTVITYLVIVIQIDPKPNVIMNKTTEIYNTLSPP